MRASASSSARCFAATEVRAAWRHARGVRLDDGRHARGLERRLDADAGGVDTLAGQRAFDEDRLAFHPRDTAALLVQRFDGQERGGGEGGVGGHGLPRDV